MAVQTNVRPVLIWQNQKNEEQNSNVIPLFKNDIFQTEDVIQEVAIQAEQGQETKITSVSSGFGEIKMKHHTPMSMAA